MTDLVVELVEIGRLREDPDNVRLHSDRNIETIRSSLRDHGQRKNIVARRDGTVIAGNGTLRAARLEGWTHLSVGWFDGTDQEAAAFAVLDNRTAELAEWNYKELAAAIGRAGGSGSPGALALFDERELALIMESVRHTEKKRPAPETPMAKGEAKPGECKCPECGEVFPVEAGR